MTHDTRRVYPRRYRVLAGADATPEEPGAVAPRRTAAASGNSAGARAANPAPAAGMGGGSGIGLGATMTIPDGGAMAGAPRGATTIVASAGTTTDRSDCAEAMLGSTNAISTSRKAEWTMRNRIATISNSASEFRRVAFALSISAPGGDAR